MIRYRLDELGWYQFEWLCQSLLKRKLGIGIEAWGGHSDLGNDAYWKGSLPIIDSGAETPGPFVFQAKFVGEANAAGAKPDSLLMSSVGKECQSIRQRVLLHEHEKPAVYVLLTNAPLSAALREKIINHLQESLSQCQIMLWGANDICAMLDDAPNIRVAFPQLLGLRDLSSLIQSAVNKPITERSTLAIDQAIELSNVFVPTASYSKSLAVLHSHGFVVLTGPPEMGKTAIARMIGLAKLGENWECYECHSPSEIFQIGRSENPQVFIADDAFGSTEYRPEIAQDWARDMDKILRTVGKERWLIWTSRPAMLNAALQKMHLQGRAERFPQPAEVVVDATNLSADEKALILYRHAKAAHLDKPAKILIREYAQRILNNVHFTPERVRRFIQTALPQISSELEKGKVLELIDREITQATASMGKSFNTLPNSHKQVLVAMLDAGREPVERSDLAAAYSRLSDQPKNIDQLISELSAHFIRVKSNTSKSALDTRLPDDIIEWMHPSWRDLVIDYLSEDASPREMFLSRCGVEGILLALSSEGGAAGLRKFPFLKSEEDLLSVAESVVRAIEQDIELSVANILYSTSELARRVSVEPIGIISLSAFNDYAIKVLSACRKRWGTLDKISLVTHVSYYYQISEYIIPLPSGPDLSNLWESAWSAAIQDIEDFTPTYTDKQHISGVSEWIDLAVTIQENEPRFLRQLEYRTDCWIRVRKFLQMLILRLELDIKFENTSDCDEEDDNLEIFGSLLESNYVVLPELKVPLCELAIAINSAKDRVNEAREEIESAEQYENESMQEFQPQSDKYAGLSLQDKIIFSMQDMYSKTEDLFSDL